MAPFVARNGPAFEALAAKLNASKPAFAFLAGGPGTEYYRWRVQVLLLLLLHAHCALDRSQSC